MNELISIIVPVFNADNFLNECIESVLQQSWSNYELLLIDDCSTDGSGAICDLFAVKDARIHVVHKNSRMGVSAARNTGLDRAIGRYIMFLDADDCLTPDCCSVLQQGFDEYNADIVSGRILDSLRPWNYGADHVIWKELQGLEESIKDNPFMYSACGKLYRSEIIGNTRFNENYRINEDTFFVFQILCKQPIFVGMRNEVYKYRTNSSSASHSAFSEKFFDIISVSEEKYSIIQNQFPSLILLAKNMKLKAKMNLLHILAVRTTGEYSQKEKELQHEIIQNAKYYQAGNHSDDKWLFIIRHHLYWLYTFIKRRI